MKTPSPQEAAKMVRELPILFAPDLAQKVHLGLKTETRRLVKPQPTKAEWGQGLYVNGEYLDGLERSPYQPGDLLYVRETWGFIAPPPRPDCGPALVIHRGEYGDKFKGPWRPSIHMPKWAARTWLEVLSVSVERVQEIDVEGLVGEGYHDLDLMESCLSDRGPRALQSFSTSWNARYPGSWDRNDWVFVYKFKKVEAPNGRA